MATPGVADPSDSYKTQACGYWFEASLAWLALLAVAGDPPPLRNEAHYLCRLKHFWDPGYCAGDLFLESPDAHFTVVWLVGWATRFVSLEAVAWIGRAVSWGLIAAGWARLTRRVTPLPLAAPVGVALVALLTEQGNFAGEGMVGGFEAKSPAYGLVLLALADAAAGRWNRAWVLLGGASAMHALVGGWSVVALMGAWWWTPGAPRFTAMLRGLFAGGCLSLAGVLPPCGSTTACPQTS